MQPIRLIITLLFISSLQVSAQMANQPKIDAAADFAATITVEDLRNHLSTLASDAYEGRETGTPGQQKAAEYIANHFQRLGLPRIYDDSSFFQPIGFKAQSWTTNELIVGDSIVRHLWEYYAYPSSNPVQSALEVDEAVFIGYGIQDEGYDDYRRADVAGKLVVFYDQEPVTREGLSQITGTADRSVWAGDWRRKVELAQAKGAAGVLIIDRNFKENVAQARKEILNTRLQIDNNPGKADIDIPNAFINTNLAVRLFGKRLKKVLRRRDKMNKKGKSKPVDFDCTVQLRLAKDVRSLEGENVLGFIEGSDAARKDEVVIITAHYDHLGTRGDAVYNGADDNGSGTSTVLEIAEAFAKAKEAGEGPRRSVLCMLVSGEEKGLLGSRYYSENPVFPLESTVANVNVDMVGRVDEAHADDPNYIYVIGADRLSSELHEINETANQTYTQLELDYTYNEKDDPNRYYYRSDHYNFAKKGIPAIFYFNGTHEDYHRSTDTVDKINFEKMEKIGQLVFHTAWELANRDKRIVVDQK